MKALAVAMLSFAAGSPAAAFDVALWRNEAVERCFQAIWSGAALRPSLERKSEWFRLDDGARAKAFAGRRFVVTIQEHDWPDGITTRRCASDEASELGSDDVFAAAQAWENWTEYSYAARHLIRLEPSTRKIADIAPSNGAEQPTYVAGLKSSAPNARGCEVVLSILAIPKLGRLMTTVDEKHGAVCNGTPLLEVRQ